MIHAHLLPFLHAKKLLMDCNWLKGLQSIYQLSNPITLFEPLIVSHSDVLMKRNEACLPAALTKKDKTTENFSVQLEPTTRTTAFLKGVIFVVRSTVMISFLSLLFYR